MSSPLSNKNQRLVSAEINKWVSEKLIDQELGETLLSRYPNRERKTNVSEVLTLIGSVLVGLGTILFIAANWSVITVGIKLTIILLAITVSHSFGWKLRFEPGKHQKLGTALLVLGSLFFGAAIWLIAQVFNIEANFSDGVLLWATGTTAVTLVTGLVPLGCLSTILLSWWCLSNNLYNFDIFDKSDSLGIIPTFLVSTSGSILIAKVLRSRVVLWIALLLGTLSMLMESTNVATPLLLWGLALFAGQLWCSQKNPNFVGPFLYVGNVSILGALLLATFGNRLHHYHINQIGVLLAVSLAVLSMAAWKLPKFRPELAICVLLAVAVSLTYGYQEAAHRMVFNIFLLMTIGGLAYAGLNRFQSMAVVNVALVFFVLDVIARYFDLFYSTMNRSLFFVGGGIVLMLVGTLAERSRRTFEKGIRSDSPDVDPTLQPEG